MTTRRSFERRLAHAALRLYPAGFRAEFGDELTAFVEALAADGRFARGAIGRIRLALYVARDTVPAALAARARAARARAATDPRAELPSTRPEGRMDTLLQDLRYAVRALVRLPALTIVAVVTLMLGIGANTAIFSIVRAVLLRPLPYPQADRLAVIWGQRANQPQLLVSVPDFEEWRTRNRSFEDVGIDSSGGFESRVSSLEASVAASNLESRDSKLQWRLRVSSLESRSIRPIRSGASDSI